VRPAEKALRLATAMGIGAFGLCALVPLALLLIEALTAVKAW
jgi:hypothetical protein